MHMPDVVTAKVDQFERVHASYTDGRPTADAPLRKAKPGPKRIEQPVQCNKQSSRSRCTFRLKSRNMRSAYCVVTDSLLRCLSMVRFALVLSACLTQTFQLNATPTHFVEGFYQGQPIGDYPGLKRALGPPQASDGDIDHGIGHRTPFDACPFI